METVLVREVLGADLDSDRKSGAGKNLGPSDTTRDTVSPGEAGRPLRASAGYTCPRSTSVENLVFESVDDEAQLLERLLRVVQDAPTTHGTGTGFGPLLTTTSIALLRGAFPSTSSVSIRRMAPTGWSLNSGSAVARV